MNFGLKLNLFFRSFFLQTGWNYAKYQNLGFTFVMMPVLRRLYAKDTESLPTVLQRYLDNFNTQPVMASFCFGALAKQEELILQPQSLTDYKEQVLEWQGIRRGLSITAASIGDRLFWGTLKPLTLLLALFVWMVAGVNFLETDYLINPSTAVILSGSVFAFVLYNVVAQWVRWKGIELGYNSDNSSCFGLTRFDWNRTIYQAKRLGLYIAILLLLLGVYHYFKQADLMGNIHSKAKAVLVLAFVMIAFITRRLRIPNVYLYLTSVVIFNLVCLL